MTQTYADEQFFCPSCSYNLFGIDSANCPECGLAIDRSAEAVSPIPWEHRDSIGRFKAFWKTVRRVNFRTKTLAPPTRVKIDLASAQRFRLICVIIAWASIVPWVIVLTISWLFDSQDAWQQSVAVWLAFAAGAVGIGVWLGVMTGFPSYFFYPRRLDIPRQNSAIAFSFYGAAALAWSFIPALLGVPLYFLVMAPRDNSAAFNNLKVYGSEILAIIIIVFVIAIAILIWDSTSRLLRYAVTESRKRQMFLTGASIILWPTTAFFFILGSAALVIALSFIWRSLQLS